MYIFEISCLSVASFAIIFSHSEGCLFTLLIVSLDVQKLLRLIRFHLFIFAFVSIVLGHLKRPDAGRDWGQEEKGTTEEEMAGWHH